MTHYEQRLENDLRQIQQRIASVSLAVEDALKNAINALLTDNHELAYTTIIGDNPINRECEAITKLCHGFIARHLPSAGHLRRVTSIIRFIIEIERIGDYATIISRETVQFSKPLEQGMKRNVELMADEAHQMLHQSVAAFLEDNAEQAKSIKGFAKQIDHLFGNIFNELVKKEPKGKEIKDLFGLMTVFAILGRVSDQSKNICEETVFMIMGETKQRRPVEILFVDEGNDCLSLMAEAIGHKGFQCGRFDSAGSKPATALTPEFIAFMDRCGFDLSLRAPKALDLIPRFDDYDIVISLQGPATTYISDVPFHTSLLNWEIGPPLAEVDKDQLESYLDRSYKELSMKIGDLMEIMRGKEAF